MCDVILIADSGVDSFSASNRLRLDLDGYPGNIQVARNFVEHGGKVVPPIVGDDVCSWESAPKLNGIYLYNYLSRQGISTSLINNFQKEQDRFRVLAAQNPKVVVISTTFMVDRQSVLALTDEVKRLCPETVVVVGGPLVNLSWRINQAAVDNPLYAIKETHNQFLFFNPEGDQVDLYVISDRGEYLLFDVVKNILAGKECREIPNTAHLDQGQYVFSPRVDDIAGREDVPIDWARLPDEVFASGVVPMQASVGCPYSCNFCNFNKDPRLTYVKPLDDLIAELKAVQRRGARYVWFVDDNFRLGKRDLEDVCRRFIAEELSLQWMSFVRPEVLKGVDLGLLKQAGCRELQMGIESADPLVLANMNKRSDPDLNEETIKRLISNGINCSSYFIFGYPGESQESLARTIAFIKRLEEHDGPGLFCWSLYPFLLAPFSPVYDNRADYGLEGYFHRWQHQTMDSDTVKKYLLKAFMALDRSSPIYRGDNLDQMNCLRPPKGKAFLTTRHQLEKLSAAGKLDTETAYQALAPLFSKPEHN